jgi:hypothetical protein
MSGERYSGRGERHPGHNDRSRVNEHAGRLESGAHSPLDLVGDLIQVDTSEDVALEELLDRVRAHLKAVT